MRSRVEFGENGARGGEVRRACVGSVSLEKGDWTARSHSGGWWVAVKGSSPSVRIHKLAAPGTA